MGGQKDTLAPLNGYCLHIQKPLFDKEMGHIYASVQSCKRNPVNHIHRHRLTMEISDSWVVGDNRQTIPVCLRLLHNCSGFQLYDTPSANTNWIALPKAHPIESMQLRLQRQSEITECKQSPHGNVDARSSPQFSTVQFGQWTITNLYLCHNVLPWLLAGVATIITSSGAARFLPEWPHAASPNFNNNNNNIYSHMGCAIVKEEIIKHNGKS